MAKVKAYRDPLNEAIENALEPVTRKAAPRSPAEGVYASAAAAALRAADRRRAKTKGGPFHAARIPIRPLALAATDNGRLAPELARRRQPGRSALWLPNPAIRKLSPSATAPRACRHMAARRHPGEVAARRRSRITAHSKLVRPPPTDTAQIMDAGACRTARIPIRPPAVWRRTTCGWRPELAGLQPYRALFFGNSARAGRPAQSAASS
jgi:hypothetical protein